MVFVFFYKYVLCKLKFIIDVCVEGVGSLLFFLKVKGWVIGFLVGVGEGGYDYSLVGYMFFVNIWFIDFGFEYVNLGVLIFFILFIFQFFFLCFIFYIYIICY